MRGVHVFACGTAACAITACGARSVLNDGATSSAEVVDAGADAAGGGPTSTCSPDDLSTWVTEGSQVWSGPWPDTQISQPAVVRTAGGRAAFSLETELSPVVGHVAGSGLAWLPIDPTPDAPGTGVGLLPVIEDGRLGVLYLGLEIPSPVQPLRYYGLRCP